MTIPLRGKRMRFPLIGQEYIYMGEDSNCFRNGETYRVIETGLHWWTELGYVAWMTTEENKDTTDADYGCAVSIGSFGSIFWKS